MCEFRTSPPGGDAAGRAGHFKTRLSRVGRERGHWGGGDAGEQAWQARLAHGLGSGVLTPAGVQPASGPLREKLAEALDWESTRAPPMCGPLQGAFPGIPLHMPPWARLCSAPAVRGGGTFLGSGGGAAPGASPDPQAGTHTPHQGDRLSEAPRAGYFWAGDVVRMLPREGECHHKASWLVRTHRRAATTSPCTAVRAPNTPRGGHASHLGSRGPVAGLS